MASMQVIWCIHLKQLIETSFARNKIEIEPIDTHQETSESILLCKVKLQMSET